MSELKQLNVNQLKVIEALAKGADEDALLETGKIKSKQTLYKWLTSEGFARQMRLRRQVARCQSELLLADNVYTAAEKLVGLMDETNKPDVARRACLDVLALVDTDLPPLYEPTAEMPVSLDRETAGRMLDLLSGATEAESEPGM
jgi:hypothetical protein